jgi:hypothetical protein
MVESNPLNRICLAMRRYSQCGEILGLRHGVEIAQYHIGEYPSFAWEYSDPRGPDFAARAKDIEKTWEAFKANADYLPQFK